MGPGPFLFSAVTRRGCKPICVYHPGTPTPKLWGVDSWYLLNGVVIAFVVGGIFGALLHRRVPWLLPAMALVMAIGLIWLRFR